MNGWLPWFGWQRPTSKSLGSSSLGNANSSLRSFSVQSQVMNFETTNKERPLGQSCMDQFFPKKEEQS